MWNVCKEWTQTVWHQVTTAFQVYPDRSSFVVSQLPQREKRLQLSDSHIATVRLAIPDDANAIYEVENEAYSGQSPWEKTAFEEDLAYNPLAVYSVMSVDERVMAFVGSRVTESDLHITNIAVHSDFRFLGCATFLLQQLEKYARVLNKQWLSLEVRASNTKAIRLYQKFGFEMTGVKPQYYKPDREDAIEMHYALPPKTPSSFSSAEFSFARLAAGERTAEKLYQLVQDNYDHPVHWSVKGYLEDLEQESNAYFGVFHLEQLIGFVGVQVVLDEATITNIVIQRDYQGQGLAQRLWQMACYDLTQRGVKTVFLEVREFNHRAQQLYEILGFEYYHRRRDYYTGPMEDALLYRLELTTEKGEEDDRHNNLSNRE